MIQTEAVGRATVNAAALVTSEDLLPEVLANIPSGRQGNEARLPSKQIQTFCMLDGIRFDPPQRMPNVLNDVVVAPIFQMETARQITFDDAVSSHPRMISDTRLRFLGTHGSHHILEVRDERGRKALRYVRETP